jgi:hyperosmotically inducible periplasmic protein
MTKLHRNLHLIAVTGAVLSLGIAGTAATAQDQNTKPDNSAQNKNQDQTAQNQSSAPSDRELTAKVRKAILADKDLSTYAHNIKIITQNGTVTLKGPVKSDDEKQKIESDVAAVVAPGSIVNQLTVTQ